jgi:type I restriction-modification system DNA methylase subunit
VLFQGQAGASRRPDVFYRRKTVENISLDQQKLGLDIDEEMEMLEGEGEEDTEEIPRKKKTKKGKAPSVSQESDMQAGMHLAKILDKVQSIEGVRAAEVFRDFLEITELSLLRLGDQFNAAMKTGGFEAEDPPEIAARWKAVVARYRKPSEVFSCFADGFAYLLDKSGTEDGELTYSDVVGCAYMQFLSLRDQSFKGQFFTPFPVARMMAEMTCGGIEKLILERIEAALRKSPLGEAMGIVLYVCKDQEGISDAVWKYILPLIADDYEPVTVMDPCVGSGVMLLAAASAIPRHYTALGLVQYCGVDIDPLCVQMTRINTMLYGLNGWSYRMEEQKQKTVSIPAQNGIWEVEKAPEAVIEAMPEPACSIYKEIRLDPTPEIMERGRKKIVEGQLALFGMAEEK